MRLSRPIPLEIELPDGRVFTLQPATRAQIRAVMALDPKDGTTETASETDERRAKQLAILAKGSSLPLNELTAEQENEILAAIMAVHHGHDPADAIALQQLLKKKALEIAKLATSESQPSTPTP